MPEKYGADVLLATKAGLVGVQRKEVRDLVNSSRDGRLAKELVQLQGCSVGVVIVEGDWQWTVSGGALRVPGFSMAQYNGLMFSLNSRNLWMLSSRSITTTIELLSQLNVWMDKADHTSLTRRPNPQNSWGKPESKDWGMWLLQSFEGIGPKQAAAIWDYFGGLPLAWTCSVDELLEVKGIGEKRAESLYQVFMED